jgi:hypothetical protein
MWNIVSLAGGVPEVTKVENVSFTQVMKMMQIKL